jgi:hypothetical protein
LNRPPRALRARPSLTKEGNVAKPRLTSINMAETLTERRSATPTLMCLGQVCLGEGNKVALLTFTKLALNEADAAKLTHLPQYPLLAFADIVAWGVGFQAMRIRKYGRQ